MRRSPAEYISQSHQDNRPVVIWLVVAGLAVVVMAMVIGAPLARAGGHSTLAFAIYGAFSKVCHQIPERSFFIADHQFAICARCTGLYVGFTAVTLCYPLVRSVRRIDTPPRRWLFIAALPLVIDFSLGYFGLWENTHLSRFLTGVLLGAVSVFYVLPGLVQLNLRDIAQVFRRKQPAVQ